MSTLAAARADNFYYPPEWEPSKGGLNKFQNSHPLGHRAKKLNQGILVIRFEVPFPIRCLGCGKHIDKGVRYNAEKKQVGAYFSTKIWEFRMRCHLCPNYIVVRTDPKNADYDIFSGARRVVIEYSAKDAETIELPDAKEKEKLANDPMFRLEHGEESKVVAKKEQPRILAIQGINNRYKDDYGLSQKLRKKFRSSKKEALKIAEENKRRGFHPSLNLLPVSEEDKAESSNTLYAPVISADANLQQQRFHIRTQSILPSQSNPVTSGRLKNLEALREAWSKKIYKNIDHNKLKLITDDRTRDVNKLEVKPKLLIKRKLKSESVQKTKKRLKKRKKITKG